MEFDRPSYLSVDIGSEELSIVTNAPNVVEGSNVIVATIGSTVTLFPPPLQPHACPAFLITCPHALTWLPAGYSRWRGGGGQRGKGRRLHLAGHAVRCAHARMDRWRRRKCSARPRLVRTRRFSAGAPPAHGWQGRRCRPEMPRPQSTPPAPCPLNPHSPSTHSF
jgi:hypothetical protein